VEKVIKPVNCPQCGYPLSLKFKYTKLIKCLSCKSDIFLDDETVRLAGKSSVIADIPSLLILYKSFGYAGSFYTPIGRIRYRSGRFVWDEWWIIDENNDGLWLSIDDGEYVLGKEIKFDLDITNPKTVKTSDNIKGWTVTETGEGICEGFEGELPEIITIGEAHHYIHLEKDNGAIMTAEFFGNEKKLYSGKWLDPYQIRRALEK